MARRGAAALFAVLVFLPPGALFVLSIGDLATGEGLSALGGVCCTGRQGALLLRSLGFSLAVAASVSLLGILVASVLWERRQGAWMLLRWLVPALLLVPPYVHALAWVSIGSGLAVALQPWGFTLPGLEGWAGAWWVEAMTYLPIGVGMALLGLVSVDPLLLEAARVRKPDIHGLLRVVLPLAAPQILAGGGLVFALSLTEFGIPSLFQVNVFATEVYGHFWGGGSLSGALVLSLPLLAMSLGVIGATQGGLRVALMRPPTAARKPAVPVLWPPWLQTLRSAGMLVLGAQILVPVTALGLGVGSWENLLGAAELAGEELTTTIWVALAAGAVSLPVALGVADGLVRRGAASRGWWFLVVLPLGIPPPLIGIGLIAVWNHPGLGLVYESWFMPVLASLARFVPMAVLVMVAHIRRMDPALFDASRVFRPSIAGEWIRVRIPLLAPGLLTAFCVTAALSAGELGATLLVAPPGRATLTMRIYNYLHYGASENVAGLCLLLLGLTLFIAFTAALAFRPERLPHASKAASIARSTP